VTVQFAPTAAMLDAFADTAAGKGGEV
jgi:hypothetical protein